MEDLEQAQEEARYRHEVRLRRQRARRDLRRLRKVWRETSTEAKAELDSLIGGQVPPKALRSGLRLEHLDAFLSDAVDLPNGHDKYFERAQVIEPLVAWWEAQKRPVTKTLYTNRKKTDIFADDGASPIIKWLAEELGKIEGLKGPAPFQVIKALLDHLRP